MSSVCKIFSFLPEKEALTDGVWNPVLLFIPLLLGVSEVNPIYFETLKSCLEMPESIGIIGGRPNHALYFVGYVGMTFL